MSSTDQPWILRTHHHARPEGTPGDFRDWEAIRAWADEIATALMSFTFLGDGLRDALDPKLKGKQ